MKDSESITKNGVYAAWAHEFLVSSLMVLFSLPLQVGGGDGTLFSHSLARFPQKGGLQSACEREIALRMALAVPSHFVFEDFLL